VKILIAILLLAIFATCDGQERRKNFWLKQTASFGMAFTAGVARGVNETINYRYDQFERRHPDRNDQFWYPKISYANKYKNGDRTQGAAFPLSTTALVMFTDGHHLTNGLAVLSFAGSMGFSLSLYEKPNIKQILVQIAVTSGGYALGKGAAHWYYRK